MNRFRRKTRHFPWGWKRHLAHFNENSSNEKRLAALGSRGRGPPQSGGRAWSFRLLEHHTGESVFSPKADLIRTFTMSSTPLKRIVLIIRRIDFDDLLDCPLLAIKTPFHPKSSRCSFSEYLYTKHFPKLSLLDFHRSLMPRGKAYWSVIPGSACCSSLKIVSVIGTPSDTGTDM